LLSRFDRPSLAALAPPITNALEDLVEQITDRLVTSDQFIARFPNLIRQVRDGFGQVTVMSEDALGEVQQSVHRLDQFVWVIVLQLWR
jgi:hypothetical protein